MGLPSGPCWRSKRMVNTLVTLSILFDKFVTPKNILFEKLEVSLTICCQWFQLFGQTRLWTLCLHETLQETGETLIFIPDLSIPLLPVNRRFQFITVSETPAGVRNWSKLRP